jgi:hypothetical protein
VDELFGEQLCKHHWRRAIFAGACLCLGIFAFSAPVSERAAAAAGPAAATGLRLANARQLERNLSAVERHDSESVAALCRRHARSQIERVDQRWRREPDAGGGVLDSLPFPRPQLDSARNERCS